MISHTLHKIARNGIIHWNPYSLRTLPINAIEINLVSLHCHEEIYIIVSVTTHHYFNMLHISLEFIYNFNNLRKKYAVK